MFIFTNKTYYKTVCNDVFNLLGRHNQDMNGSQVIKLNCSCTLCTLLLKYFFLFFYDLQYEESKSSNKKIKHLCQIHCLHVRIVPMTNKLILMYKFPSSYIVWIDISSRKYFRYKSINIVFRTFK